MSSCVTLLLLPSVFPSIRVFFNESVLRISWPSIGASASASVLPMNIQDLFPLGLTNLISLLYKGLSRIFSSTIILNHQFFGAQPSEWSNSQILTCLLELPAVVCIKYFTSLICSVQFSHSLMFDSLQPHGLQHTRVPCPSLSPRDYSNSCPSSQ